MHTEQKLPKKIGRPPKPGGPMTNKQRQQAWRDRQRAIRQQPTTNTQVLPL